VPTFCVGWWVGEGVVKERRNGEGRGEGADRLVVHAEVALAGLLFNVDQLSAVQTARSCFQPV
jgi:hypothetical protein